MLGKVSVFFLWNGVVCCDCEAAWEVRLVAYARSENTAHDSDCSLYLVRTPVGTLVHRRLAGGWDIFCCDGACAKDSCMRRKSWGVAQKARQSTPSHTTIYTSYTSSTAPLLPSPTAASNCDCHEHARQPNPNKFF